MTTETLVHPELRVIECVASGEFDLPFIEASRECRIYALEHNFCFLMNATDVLNFPIAMEVSPNFKKSYSGMEQILRSVRTALLITEDQVQQLGEVRNDWNALGAQIEAFTDRKKAEEWLQQG